MLGLINYNIYQINSTVNIEKFLTIEFVLILSTILKIKFYRNELNLSQEQLANKCNLSGNSIYNYENNKRIPTILTLKVIAENSNILLLIYLMAKIILPLLPCYCRL